eukprot:CAMPEP_0196667296 /NCGR_PEP_ID=MMETSP1086-20130531/65003_1 /TAXON_ID=77921 /ORGANISM="Cyanoptyche  gloeocystis , Strain SAG4.97" /LENGTH=273 /DNA_ID=CAMNT_0042004611 /DNA_START=104 /DNA_END=925 /DNA_ORIENTATION=+
MHMLAVQLKEVATKTELENLKRCFETLDKKSDGKLDPDEVHQQFVELKHRVTRNQVEDMIWEADEDCDRVINWPEFQQLFYRCRQDRTGTEPHSLFHLIEFMMQDADGGGTVSISECIGMMYLRYGKDLVEKQVRNMFDQKDIDENKDLTFTEFHRQLLKAQKANAQQAQQEYGEQMEKNECMRSFSPLGARSRRVSTDPLGYGFRLSTSSPRSPSPKNEKKKVQSRLLRPTTASLGHRGFSVTVNITHAGRGRGASRSKTPQGSTTPSPSRR